MYIVDGQIGSNFPRNTPRLDLTDGNWHLIVVTTESSGAKVSFAFLR